MILSNLGQSLASAVSYIQNHSSIEALLYFDEIPEEFVVPSIYFPVPRVICKKVTLASFCFTVMVNCQFMAVDQWEAYQYAADVRDHLLVDHCAIPILKKDGLPEGNYMRITEPEIRNIDHRSVQLSFDLKQYVSFEKTEEVKAKDIIFAGIVKKEELKDVWMAATKEQRLEQEVQQACLQKAMINSRQKQNLQGNQRERRK